MEAGGMTEQQRLFLVQARSNYNVFQILRDRQSVPVCHLLHYLQMSTELFGKAWGWRHGSYPSTHRAFVPFLRGLTTNRRAQSQSGYEGRNESWEHLIRKGMPLAMRIEKLAPDLAGDGPNPEYPWPRHEPGAAPVEHTFEVWEELRDTAYGRQFLKLLDRLFASAESYL